jgi:hypothetical protein
LAINKTCTGPCVDEAGAFVAMMNGDQHLRADVFPALDTLEFCFRRR